MLKIHLFYIFFLQIRKKAVPLYRVFHGFRFKVNGRLVVEMTTFFFFIPFSLHFWACKQIANFFLSLFFCDSLSLSYDEEQDLFLLLPFGFVVRMCAVIRKRTVHHARSMDHDPWRITNGIYSWFSFGWSYHLSHIQWWQCFL